MEHVLLTYQNYSLTPRVKWAPCEHGMADPRNAGGGDGLITQKSRASDLDEYLE
jgi:hypothetical protein